MKGKTKMLLSEMLYNAHIACITVFKLLPAIIIIGTPYLCVYLVIRAYNIKEIPFSVKVLPLIAGAVVYLLRSIRKVFSEGLDDFPVARKRFTSRKPSGQVIFNMSDLYEMVDYLAEVEEYCIKYYGKYEQTKTRKKWFIFLIACVILLAPMNTKAAENSGYALSEEEEILLQQVALAEAGNQGVGGMAFVMQVIMNRVGDDNFPDTVKGVIQQKGQFATYTSGGYLHYQPTANSKKAVWLLSVLENRGQLYFENPHGKRLTWQSRNLDKVFEYEDHVFYK